MKQFLILFLSMIVCNIIQSQTVTDYDGNVYQTIIIGNQTWMAENLRTTRYSDGTPIEDGTGLNEIEWEDQTKRFFYYNDDPSYADNFGCLYTWYAAVNGTNTSDSDPSGIQGVCPAGWHLPSNSEWRQLETNAGGEDIAGTNLKPDGESGFNAVFGGMRNYNDPSGGNQYFFDLNSTAFYISSTEDNPETCVLFIITSNEPYTSHGFHNKCCGYPIRCLKDPPTTEIDNINTSSLFCLHPNPCNDYLYIDPENLKIERVTIYSPEGKIIKSTRSNGENKIPVFDIKNGFYIMKIYSDNNIYTDKLIIK